MRAKTLQIIWHSKDPVFSIDFHPDGYFATGGADREIKVSLDEGAVALAGHSHSQQHGQHAQHSINNLIGCARMCQQLSAVSVRVGVAQDM
jgi:WD40 repeat protein